MPFKLVSLNAKESLNINFYILTIFGVWMPLHFSGFKKYLYKVYSFGVLGFCLYVFLLTEIINVILVLGDVELMVKASFLTLTHIVQVYKTVNTMYRRSRIGKLIESLDEPLLNEVDPEVLPKFRYSLALVKMTMVTFMVSCFVTVALWAIFPFLESEGGSLPLMSWYPFDTSCTPNFQLVFAYQIITTLINAWCNISQDTLISGSMALACIQLDILCDKLVDQRLRYVPFGDSESFNSADRLAHNDEIRKHLENCIEHHLAIIRFVKEVENIFGVTVLIQFGATTFIICVTAFKMTTLSVSIELLSMVIYLTLVLVEIFLFCYHGNELIIKSQQMNDAAYNSPWYEQSAGSRKLIFLLMERSKIPLKVTAVIFDLSLDTFMSILRSSYSYFALLQQVNNK